MRARTIARLGAPTPLVVPSFSSRGFPAIDDILLAVKAHIYGPCLVSAYDLARGTVADDLSGLGDVVVVDSGGYETATYQPAVGEHFSPPATGAWTREDYRAFLKTLPDGAPVVIVAFDHHADVGAQLESAMEDFACAPGAARCLLIKPAAAGEVLCLAEPIPPAARSLEVVGVTENELGQSMVDRGRALVALRRALGEEVPIHVFGTITPRSMLAYAMCGADIFDGLNWLRFDYVGGQLRAIADLAVGPEACGWRDDLLRVEVWRRNLRWLGRFQTWLQTVAVDGTAALETGPLARADVEDCLALARRCGAVEG